MTLTATSTINTTSYLWFLPAGFSAPSNVTTNPTITVTYTETASGSIKVLSRNANCNNHESEQSEPFEITRPAPPNPTITKNSTNYEICSGESWILTCNSDLGNSYGYDWYVSYAGSGAGVLLNGTSPSPSSPLHTTTNTVTLTSPSGYGIFFVSVRLNNGSLCQSGYVSFQGKAGVYSNSNFSISGPSVLCPYQTASYLTTYIGPDIQNYIWSSSSSLTIQSGQGTPYLGVSASSNFNSGSITLKLTNRCGTTGTPSVKIVNRGSCGYSFTASPNPTASTIQVTILNNSDQVNTSRSINASMVNSDNLVVWTGVIAASTYSIDVSNLPKGTYYLKISDGSEIQTKRIKIDH